MYEPTDYQPTLTFVEAWETLNAVCDRRSRLAVYGPSHAARHLEDVEAKLRALLFPVTPDLSGWAPGEVTEAYGR